ncbi:MAG: GtrA family protein [Pseudomonadota bacterium]
MDEPQVTPRSPTALLGRYGVVGVFNTMVSYSVYCLAVYVGFGLALAAFVGTAVGICVSFLTMGTLVFRTKLKGRFPKFLALWACLYVLNIALIWVFVRAGASAYLAGLLAAGPVIALSFVVQRTYVFR